jgi:hypothetical protein
MHLQHTRHLQYAASKQNTSSIQRAGRAWQLLSITAVQSLHSKQCACVRRVQPLQLCFACATIAIAPRHVAVKHGSNPVYKQRHVLSESESRLPLGTAITHEVECKVESPTPQQEVKQRKVKHDIVCMSTLHVAICAPVPMH